MSQTVRIGVVSTSWWADSILENHVVNSTLYDGFKTQQVMKMALERIETGSRVEIENVVSG